MRYVSFVEHLQLEFSGNLMPQAMVLGDVDNDQDNELVAGNVNGQLMVFKGADTTPWRMASGLGMTSCAAVGDVCNTGKNVIMTLSAEGWCHVFSVAHHEKQNEDDEKDKEAAMSQEKGGPKEMTPVYQQLLAANAQAIVIADIDKDGKNEVVIGYTDRVVRAYSWVENASPATTGQDVLSRKFVLLQTWELVGQVGSIVVTKGVDGQTELLASQPGCTYTTLLMKDSGKGEGGDKETEEEEEEEERQQASGETVIFHPLVSSRARNPDVSTEIIGNLATGPSDDGGDCPGRGLYAMCTLDGTLMLGQGEEIVWSLQVDHHLFSLTKLDVTRDGKDEIVACGWDGQTYIMDHLQNMVRFQFDQPVNAFCAGLYAVMPGRNVPCLVYATFHNNITLHFNTTLPCLLPTTLTDVLADKERVTQLLEKLHLQDADSGTLQQLYHWCIYGQP
ncbi:ITFG2 [Branchiostoma lanceolatum]|uniref:ITFG2 protein n=1 Tax=Branchiostoma lanceolatum TaxID=7740 RepID=A0A8J9ZP85_BRALA|nr:ITFG2 [Branchiostoma lanceolatum]